MIYYIGSNLGAKQLMSIVSGVRLVCTCVKVILLHSRAGPVADTRRLMHPLYCSHRIAKLELGCKIQLQSQAEIVTERDYNMVFGWQEDDN